MELFDIITLNLDGIKFMIFTKLQEIFNEIFPDNDNENFCKFEKEYLNNLRSRNYQNQTDFKKLQYLITNFKQSINNCDFIINKEEMMRNFLPIFDSWLDYSQKQINQFISKLKESRVNGFEFDGYNLKFYCVVCNKYFQIPKDKDNYIFRSEKQKYETFHHDKAMEIRLIVNSDSNISKFIKIEGLKDLYSKSEFSSRFLLDLDDKKLDNINTITILSVGIDIGSSTTHLIFSRLTLKRELSFENPTNRFNLSNRDILYKSSIIKTPFFNSTCINEEKILTFVSNEYQKTGIYFDMIDTGAVIITGESAKKENAEEIVKKISSSSGKFVSATAGPNFESQLGALGSGAVKRSLKNNKTIMNVDIGGGTSNIAIIKNGIIISTSCVNVGGALLGIEEDFKIWRLDEPAKLLMIHFDMHYEIGDIITEIDYQLIIEEFARILLEVMSAKAETDNAKKLMMTSDLEFSNQITEYSFSGGVAEFIYGKPRLPEFKDIGFDLAKEIKKLCEKKNFILIEPENKIRATVIGAGSFSLSISGSTSYVDKTLHLPLINIPVIIIDIIPEEFSIEMMISKIRKAFLIYDFIEGENLVAVYFKEPIYYSANYLLEFSKAIEIIFEKSIKNKIPIIILSKMDFGRVLGTIIKRETKIKENLICLDELELLLGDYIDIGAQLANQDAYPVTIKSLAFY
jgi:ethanolamine utilization protein EutA